MQLTGQNNGGIASSAFLLARKCNWLARTCIMNMRNATCVGTQTSKVPTRVTPLFIPYTVLWGQTDQILAITQGMLWIMFIFVWHCMCFGFVYRHLHRRGYKILSDAALVLLAALACCQAHWCKRRILWCQTGKLGGFRRDLGGATAVKSKGRGEKSYPGAGSRAARGAKTNAAMYMSNEYRYLKSTLFNYYVGHGTGMHCVDVQPC